MIFSPSTRSLQTSLPFLLTFLRLSNAQARDNEADEARITDPTLECTPYNWPPLAPLVALYPANWLTATIVQGDTVATNLFNSLNSTIPNIPSKGTITNSVTGVTYNTTTDPDCWWTETQCTTPKRPGIPKDVVSCPEPGVWGLTYDDGPNCSHNAFYDYLLSANQKATLFYIGSNMENHPLEAQRGLADGHEICVHTWSHPYMTSLSNEQAFAELYYTKQFIKDLLGITVKCWRPPFGDVDDRIRYIANALGMATVIWVADTFDYEWTTIGLPAVDTNYQNIINSAPTYTTNGPIILSHELDNGTMSEAEKWLPTIQKTFKAVMPVAVCHNNSQPYLENSYVYPNFAEWVSGSRMYSATSTFAGMNATNAPVSGFANIVSGQSVSTDPGYATPTITGGIPTSTTSTTQLTSVSGSKSSSSASSTGSGKPSGGSTTSGGTRVSMFGIWMAVTVGILAGLCLL